MRIFGHVCLCVSVERTCVMTGDPYERDPRPLGGSGRAPRRTRLSCLSLPVAPSDTSLTTHKLQTPVSRKMGYTVGPSSYCVNICALASWLACRPAGGGPIGAGRCLGPVAKSPCRFRWRIHKPHPTDTAVRVPGLRTHITLRAPGLCGHTSRCAPQKATPTPPYHRDSGTRQTHNSAPLVPGLGLKHVWWTSRPPTPP